MFHLITDRAKTEQIFSRITESLVPTAIDTETVGVDPSLESPVGLGRACLVSLYNPSLDPLPFVITQDAIMGLQGYLRGGNPKIFANAKFDLHIFANDGLTVNGVLWDTVTADALVDENRIQHGLKPTTKDYLGLTLVEMMDIEPNTNWLLRNKFDEFTRYSAEDALATYGVFLYQENVLSQIPWKGKTYKDFMTHYLNKFQMAIWKMERRGICMNLEYLTDAIKKMEVESAILESDIYKQAGKKLNLNSHQQISELLYQKLHITPKRYTPSPTCTACGKTVNKKTNFECKIHGKQFLAQTPSTDAKALKSIKHPIAKMLTARQELEKLKSYCKEYVAKTAPWGRLHTTFRIYGAVTGRLSSSRPNLQNVPSRESKWKIRQAFTCPEGKSLICCDESQLEYRIIAHNCQDPLLVAAIRAGEDIHCSVAKLLFNLECPASEVKEKYPELRKKGKNLNFGVVYGMGPDSLAESLGITKREAEGLMDEYHQRFPDLDIHIESVHRQAQIQGMVFTALGRRRSLPAVYSSDKKAYYHALRQAFNFTIQGFAADLLIAAQIKLDKNERLAELGVEMLLQVHDEIVFEVPTENAQEAVPLIKQIMEHPLAKDLSVPLIADPAIGQTWREAKD